MICLVMCGGRGTRMNLPQEKLLLKYKYPIVEHVLLAVEESACFSKIIAATSPNAPRTKEFLTNMGISTMDTAGKGYVYDLNQLLFNFDDQVFVVSADLPLLDKEIIQKIVNLADVTNTWTTVLISKEFLDSINQKAEYTVIYQKAQFSYSGISIVDPKKLTKMKPVEESYIILDDRRIALNINRKEEYDLLCAT